MWLVLLNKPRVDALVKVFGKFLGKYASVLAA